MTKSKGLLFKRGASLAEKIEHFGIPEPNSGCLLWLGSVDARGYAVTSRNQSVARLILNTPPDLMALHTCDVRCCVERNHLYSGTHANNMQDIHKREIQMWAGCIWVPIYEVMTRKHLTVVTLEENLELAADIGLDATTSLDEAFAAAMARHGADASVAVLPYARYQLPRNAVRMAAAEPSIMAPVGA